MQKDDRILDELKSSRNSQTLMLGNCWIQSLSVPHNFISHVLSEDGIFAESMSKLRRLDLSHNYITEIPPSISLLTNLRELWLQGNPISRLIPEMQSLKKLEVLDIRNTKIEELPLELGMLDNLFEVDWKNTPMAKNYEINYGIPVNDIVKLKEYLITSNTRKTIELTMYDFLLREHFVYDADKPHIRSSVRKLVTKISSSFDNLDDLKQYGRKVGKLLPGKMDDVVDNTVQKSINDFYQMRRDTDRQRLAADVDIKLRGMYYDRIERTEVTALLDSIYKHVESLEDIQFLVKYAPQVLPAEPNKANGSIIWKNILTLQEELTQQRETAVQGLANAMTQLYPEQLTEDVKKKAIEIASSFQLERFATKKELTRMTQLTAECSKIFPPDFASVDREEIIRKAQVVIFSKG